MVPNAQGQLVRVPHQRHNRDLRPRPSRRRPAVAPPPLPVVVAPVASAENEDEDAEMDDAPPIIDDDDDEGGSPILGDDDDDDGVGGEEEDEAAWESVGEEDEEVEQEDEADWESVVEEEEDVVAVEVEEEEEEEEESVGALASNTGMLPPSSLIQPSGGVSATTRAQTELALTGSQRHAYLLPSHGREAASWELRRPDLWYGGGYDGRASWTQSKKATMGHVGTIMETDMGEQRLGEDRCERCRRNNHECWVYSEGAGTYIKHALPTCARCRFTPGPGGCSLSPRKKSGSMLPKGGDPPHGCQPRSLLPKGPPGFGPGGAGAGGFTA